ncbi:TPA: hypothetical protein P6523_004669 [Escherichia coli]|nr:hypothetical protein [Escherichia coli]
MTNNDLLSDAKFSSPLENSVEKVVYVGVALIAVIFIYIVIVYIVGVVRKESNLKDAAFNMVSSIVHGMSFFFVAGQLRLLYLLLFLWDPTKTRNGKLLQVSIAR